MAAIANKDFNIADLEELLNLQANALSLNSLNISWSLQLTLALSPTYTLVVNSSTVNQSWKLNRTHTVFTSPTAAPPCEIYNFSVTASYDKIGTTYSGAECCVPTSLYDRMVPSAPRFNNIETFPNHSLTNNGYGNLSLAVHFKVSYIFIYS